MKNGKEYERFVYDRFVTLFKDFNLTLNDKILGNQSGIKREIDISIKGKIADLDILYLVQCKDHRKPADVKIIGEFSAVIRDVGASKGFLICTSGFTKTIHNYARTLGIELLTVEDIHSGKWKAEVEIPIIYIQCKQVRFKASLMITANEALVERYPNGIEATLADFKYVSTDGGKTASTINDYIKQRTDETKADLFHSENFEISTSSLMMELTGIWVDVKEFLVFPFPEWTYYLRYVTPSEYSHILDHLQKTVIPLQWRVNDLPLVVDENCVEVNKETLPIVPGLSVEIESLPVSFENVTITE